MCIMEHISSENIWEHRIPNSVIGRVSSILISSILEYTSTLGDFQNKGKFHLFNVLMFMENPKTFYTDKILITGLYLIFYNTIAEGRFSWKVQDRASRHWHFKEKHVLLCCCKPLFVLEFHFMLCHWSY